MADRIGQQLGNYRLTRLLGQGGFAEVYLAVHVHLGSQAAIKLLHAQLASDSEIEKFRVEAQTIVTLNHPNIVRILDFGVDAGIPYLVMDYAPNGSLRQRLPADTPLPASTILPYVMQVAAALQYAHEQKLVHRDVKPENMLLGRNQEALLTDFGIAVVAQNTSIQKTQGVAGTAAYMAPEQLQGRPRPASDLYALGVVVYEWLCGERPFQGGPLEVISQHVLAPPPPLREKVPGVPPAIEQVVLTALAKDPRERFGSVRAFANAFGQACREAGMVYVTSQQPGAPSAPAPLSPSALSQASTVISNTPMQPAAPPGGWTGQPTPSIFSATTHITPPLASPMLTPPAPAGQGGQGGASLFAAQTLLTPPAPASAQANTGPTSTPPAFGGMGGGGAITSGAQGIPLPTTPPAQGWAALVSPTGPDVSPQVTLETAYRVGGPANKSGEYTLAGAPVVPGGFTPGGGKGQRKGGWRRWGLIAAACVLALALIGGAAAYGLPLLFHTSSTGTSSATGATVTITPAKSDLSNTLNLTAVMGTPDASKQQVEARTVSVTTQSYPKTVQATGQKTTPGTHATGTIEVDNNDPNNPLTLPAGSTYPNQYGCGSHSLKMVFDAVVNLAPASGGNSTFTRIPAHIYQVGTIGNGVNDNSCSDQLFFSYDSSGCGSVCWYFSSYSAFTGGTDPQTYSIVQQSDIDGAANSLIQANQPNPQQVLQSQLQQGEQLVDTPQCTPNVSANHQAGDQASTVTVTFTCTGEAYDHDGALAMAARLLMDQAASNPGAGYALVGKIKTSLVSATPDSQGVVAIVVSAEGIWAFQFSASQQQALAHLIAGKSKQDAMNLLLAQTGVTRVTIVISSGSGQTLPTDARQITIMIQAVSGL